MWRQRLCLGVTPTLGLAVEEQIALFAKTGFEAFFTGWDHGVPVEKYKGVGDELGLIYQSIHAPFHGKALAANMWLPGEVGRIAAGELCRCLEVCSENEIGIMVAHVYIGFEYEMPDEAVKACGLENFGIVADRAAELGVKVAFENTEGEEFLDVLMQGFKNHPAVGFCWDTGHEQCYNRGKDMCSLYGDKLVATHLNDNLGVYDFGGKTRPRDDLHLLPFDGITNWQSVADRLDACGFDGIMTFELKRASHAGRHDNDIYAQMSPEMYVAEAYKRACRVAAMRRG
ncbi:MAG: sugar phosphate isomerase/epimerase [Clostridia bacterium]|nr:sugar phosphate isomerase/epimerase [Clostridia bacterium]